MYIKKSEKYTFIQVEVRSGKEKINIYGLSEGALGRISRVAALVDANFTVDEYCTHVLRNYTYKNLRDCDGCSLKDKIEILRKKHDPGMSVSSFCREIVLTQLRVDESGK